MESLSPAWDEVSEGVLALQKRISRVASVNVNSRTIRQEASELAQRFLRSAKPELERFKIEKMPALEQAFVALLKLSTGNNSASSYKRCLKTIRQQRGHILATVELNSRLDAPSATEQSQTERQIAETLNKIVPSASLSYQQAVHDLADSTRQSFRGPALELREALREILDELAPDAVVEGADNFRLEPGQKKPTMRQKVQFLLRARGRSKTASATPKEMVETVDALVGTVVRSVYNHGSLTAHVASTKADVMRLKRYVDVVFADLLEL